MHILDSKADRVRRRRLNLERKSASRQNLISKLERKLNEIKKEKEIAITRNDIMLSQIKETILCIDGSNPELQRSKKRLETAKIEFGNTVIESFPEYSDIIFSNRSSETDVNTYTITEPLSRLSFGDKAINKNVFEKEKLIKKALSLKIPNQGSFESNAKNEILNNLSHRKRRELVKLFIDYSKGHIQYTQLPNRLNEDNIVRKLALVCSNERNFYTINPEEAFVCPLLLLKYMNELVFPVELIDSKFSENKFLSRVSIEILEIYTIIKRFIQNLIRVAWISKIDAIDLLIRALVNYEISDSQRSNIYQSFYASF